MSEMTENEVSQPERLTADELRALGVSHPLLSDDEQLVAIVRLLLDIGVSLDDMIEGDLTYLAAPKLIRPDATIEPYMAFSDDDTDREFRAKAGVALGFHIDEDSRLLTPAEVDTIQFFRAIRDIVGDEDTLAMMRVMGTAMGRVARSVVSALRLHYETPIMDATGSLAEVALAYRSIVEELLPSFLDASSTVLRRHVAVASTMTTAWNVDKNRSGTMERITVGFVDLVGFTSFTERADLQQFVEALTAFESQAQEVIVTNGGTLVKLIGDEAMFVAPTPASGIEIGRRLATLPLDGSGPASVRIGLAAGEVVAVGGDYYGTIVNTASRIVHEAEPDSIVVTAPVANGAHASARFEDLGLQELRGISEPVALFKLL